MLDKCSSANDVVALIDTSIVQVILIYLREHLQRESIKSLLLVTFIPHCSVVVTNCWSIPASSSPVPASAR
jgi:hypothetical protein